MKRFLVCMVKNLKDESTQPYHIEAFPVKNATTPDEVTTPLGTAIFFFAKAKSLEDLYPNVLLFGGNSGVSLIADSLKITSPMYLYGTLIQIFGEVFVFNKDILSLFSVENLDNYEVIPLD